MFIFSLLPLIWCLIPHHNMLVLRDCLWFWMKNWCGENWLWVRNWPLHIWAVRVPRQSVMCFINRKREANRVNNFHLFGANCLWEWKVWIIFPCMCVLVVESCLILCYPIDCCPPSYSVHGIPRQEYWSG